MSARIHPSAVVDPSAELADGVVVGPHAVVGPEVVVGEGTEIGASAHLAGPARLGRENRLFPHAAIGLPPQDLKYRGERVSLEIGDRNQFREFCTVHLGTGGGGGVTRVGSDNLFMVSSHVAHDCRIGDRTVFANCATLAGHVEVADDAVVGAFCAVHQFCRVGRHAYLGGFTRLLTDALPFVKTLGIRPACYGVNRVGLSRKGWQEADLRAVESAVRILLRSGLNTSRALARIEEDLGGHPEVRYLVEFVRASRRGVVRAVPGRRGAGEETTGD